MTLSQHNEGIVVTLKTLFNIFYNTKNIGNVAILSFKYINHFALVDVKQFLSCTSLKMLFNYI